MGKHLFSVKCARFKCLFLGQLFVEEVVFVYVKLGWLIGCMSIE